MASANGSTECSSGNVSSAVPQWKRDLIQRRRQQNKVLTSNGPCVKSCSAVSAIPATTITSVPIVDSSSASFEPLERLSSCHDDEQRDVAASSVSTSPRSRTSDNIGPEYSSNNITTTTTTILNRHSQQFAGSSTKLTCHSSCGATCHQETCLEASTIGEAANIEANPEICGVNTTVVFNMRLETDASSFCSASEDPMSFVNGNTTRNNRPIITSSIHERASVDFVNYDSSEDTMKNYVNNVSVINKRSNNNREEDCENVSGVGGGGGGGGGGIATRIIRRIDDKTSVCLYPTEQTRANRPKIETCSIVKASNGRTTGDECESDSSEELQYGPGIVNRLKSKYLNLTLREMNKSRSNVQRFRRAASLEDLLDCDDEQCEQQARKYTKRSVTGAAMKNERYRNSTRGNESMKRARSVETLMRYNAPLTSDESSTLKRFAVLGQEPINDHIVLIDRTSVKIESRLSDNDRPKAVNKPKRIKPLLAETERPPADLVKTTMRLFEGSVKKFKPKGDVAVKVATFKTINDTYKATQVMKKVVPKPPLQSKSFVNGNNQKISSSPKKIQYTSIKPTAEIIEQTSYEEKRREGVIAEPIVQSVSSVVSKFQQIEKSYTPASSPEPICKHKFSPSPSPEPALIIKLARSNDNIVKSSSPITPVTSPRLTSPTAQSPPTASPKKDTTRRSSSPVNSSMSPVTPSPSRELFVQAASSTEVAVSAARNGEQWIDTRENSGALLPIIDDISRRAASDINCEIMEIIDDERATKCCAITVDENRQTIVTEQSCVDGARTISKIALENISKAGITMQYSFDDESSIGKTYLPGVIAAAQNGVKPETTNGETIRSEVKVASILANDISACSSPMSMDSINDEPATEVRLCERLEPEKTRETRSYARESSPCLVAITNQTDHGKSIGAISSLGLMKSSSVSSTTASSYPTSINEISGKTIRSQKSDVSPPQKQIGIIRPLVSTKTQQQSQQCLSNRELEKNLINRVKSIEQPTKVVVSLKNSAEEIQPVKKTAGSPVGSGVGGGGGGLWDTKPWNQANNTMVFNFSNRKDVPDYIENDGLIIRRKREKQKVGDGGVIVLDATLDASTTDDSDWEISGGPPSPCDVSFTNDNVLINGRSNLSKQPRNHKHRIQFDDGATRTFEYPSEASMLEDEGTSVDGDSSSTSQQSSQGIANKSNSASSTATMSSALLGGGGLASFTPSKVDLASEGFELGVTRTTVISGPCNTGEQIAIKESEEYLKSDEDAAAWGAEATADLLY